MRKFAGMKEKEYGELYKELCQYDDLSLELPEQITVGDKTYQKTDILDALEIAREELIKTGKHNEMNVLSPRIQAIFVKGSSITDIPQNCRDAYLEIAEKYNLPIVFIPDTKITGNF